MAAQKIFGIELVIPDHKKKSYNPPISVDDVYEVIDEILIIDDSEMSRVQMYGQDPHRIDITMKNSDGFNRYIETHLDEKFLLRSGKVIKIVKPFEAIKEVRVRRVPGVWDESDLARIFNFYGEIKSIDEEFMRPSSTNGIRQT